MKKLITLAAIFTISFSGAVTAKQLTFGISLSTLNNPFFVSLKEGAVAKAKQLGVKLIVVDSQDNPATEAKNIEDLVTKRVDALLINPTDSSAIVPSIVKANRAGIPVFTIDRGASRGKVVSHVASDNVLGGEMAAKFLLEKIGGKGNVVELEGIAGTSAALDRGKGFNKVVGANGKVRVVSRQTANFNRAEGLRVFENILQAQPKIDGVFAHNDEMILGAIQAAKAAGRSGIVFVGFDAVDDAVNAVKGGSLAATVAQKPSLIGELGVKAAYEHLSGKAAVEYIPVPLALVK